MKDPWFPRRFAPTPGIHLDSLLYWSGDWQIYSTAEGGPLLAVADTLLRFWLGTGLVAEGDFLQLPWDTRTYALLAAPQGSRVLPLDGLQESAGPELGLAFATAMAETRKIHPAGSLSGGIFVEHKKRILPLPSAKDEDDSMVLGRCLTGGIGVSARTADALLRVQNRLDKEQLQAILRTAGLAGTQERESAESGPAAAAPRGKKPFSLPGRETLETFFRDHVIDIIENERAYAAMNIHFPGAFILQGPPGCGKTFAVDKLVEYLDWPVYRIDSASIGSPYIHDTGKKIAEVFNKAIGNAPSLLIMDEMESFMSSREAMNGSSTHHLEEIAEFLRRIPEAVANKVLVIGMTNLMGSLDSAICRRGRFDHVIEVGMPSVEEISQVLDHLLSTLPHEQDIDTKELAAALDGAPLSDISFLVRESARLTAHNHEPAIRKETLEKVAEQARRNIAQERRTIGFFP